MKNLFKEAHKLTKEIKAEYPNIDYKAQFGICLSYLQEMKGECKMVELKGSEKQIKWAKDIRQQILSMKDNYEIAKSNLRVLSKEEESQAQAWNKVVKQEELNNIDNKFEKYLNTNSAKLLIDNFAYSKLSKNILTMIENKEYKHVVDSLDINL